MPGPSSPTLTVTASLVSATLSHTCVPGPQYFTALSIRFVSTCSIARRSARTLGRVAQRALFQSYVLLAGAFAEQAEHLREDRFQLDRFEAEPEAARFDPRQIKQVFDQLLQPLPRFDR